MSMDGMAHAPGPSHARKTARDHLWVLAVIAAFALFDVWESWTQVGNKSGFAHGTGWTLTVIVEAYACYALYAWFGAPGPRSRRFAMWSAAGVLVLSLIGQGSSVLAAHRMPPLWLAVFVKDLPVAVLALIAMLIHLRQKDRADAAEGEERSVVQAELDALRAERDTAVSGLAAARTELAEAVAEAETANRKLEATARKRAPVTARKPARATARKPEPATGSVTGPEGEPDVDREALVLKYLAEGKKASEAGRLAGLSDSRGRQIARALAKAAPKGQDPEDSHG